MILPSQRAKVYYPLPGVITNPHPLGGDLLIIDFIMVFFYFAHVAVS